MVSSKVSEISGGVNSIVRQDDLLLKYGFGHSSNSYLERLIRIMEEARSLLLSLAAESKSDVRLPVKDTFRAWCHGFSRWRYSLYCLERNDIHQYVSPRIESLANSRINGFSGKAMQHKLLFTTVLRSFDAPCPDVYALILKGRVHALDGFDPDLGDSLLDLLLEERGECIVLKPFRACRGDGIFFLWKQGGRYLINGCEISWLHLASIIHRLDNYMVTKYIVQHEYASRLYPKTTNTIRLLMMWDYEITRPFIASAAHRIGTSRSYPVDNFMEGKGGLSALINIETGELGDAVYRSNEGNVERVSLHPETGSQIKGIKVHHIV